MVEQSLTGSDVSAIWTLRLVGPAEDAPRELAQREVPAAVPGCVHTDLMAAGLLPDPYLADHEQAQHWIGQSDWEYRCAFEASPELFVHERLELVCRGLDTIATVVLNGRVVGDAANMHHAHRFDAKPHLKPGRNELAVRFDSPVRDARQWMERLGKLPYLNTPDPYNFIRKMACNFGWDWGPTLVTSGIWKSIELAAWDEARIEQVRPLVMRADEDAAVLDVHVDVVRSQAPSPSPSREEGSIRVELALRDPDDRVVAEESLPLTSGAQAMTKLKVDQPRLWWPIGHGEQPLYALTVILRDEAGRELDRWSKRLGLRQVELDTSPDEVGSRFTIKVNGKPIFCKGANWIPDDCFLNRVTPERYHQRIEQATGANMNMLRVWGGGIYETDAFYDLCDELGVMVWQDFLFACAAYPEEEPFRSRVEAEARENVARLSRHPSLVIWNGCNENVWGYHDWGWKKAGVLKGRTWGPGYYFDLLPRITAELDPSRPYWAASPWSGDRDVDNGLYPNDEHFGNKHVWEAWFGEEYRAYRRFAPRFCSEFGFQAPAAWATLHRAVGSEQLYGGSAMLQGRQKSPAGDANNQRHLESFFVSPDPADHFDDWHYLLQVNQARALTLGVEWFRSRQPICMGTLYWQLNDCCPVVSWAAIDGDGRRKPLWYATRRFYADRLLTIQPALPEANGPASPEDLRLFAVNDSDHTWRGNVRLRRMTLEGEVLVERTLALEVAPRRNHALTLPSAVLEGAAEEYLVAQAEDHRALWFFDVDLALPYPVPDFDAGLERTPGGYALTVRANTLMRDVCQFVDRLDPAATVDDQFVTLLPGDEVAFQITTQREMTLAELTQPPVFQCVNRFGLTPSLSI